MTTLTQALEEAYSTTVAVPIIDTIEIRHPAFTSPVRVARGFDDVDATLEADAPVDPGQTVTFLGLMFEFIPPQQRDSGALPTFGLQIDGVSLQIARELDAAVASLDIIEITYRPYLANDLTAPHMNPPLSAQLKDVSVNATRVSARVGFKDLTNMRFPRRLYTRENAPGLG